ncbi:MAG: 4-hydroxythreonine-4-phosphate dehydrogenase PdxA [Desulfurococcus sp.]|uniref:4-hydroxythreonine-4-phosphate dehydrogenase PdxA n=1 Tax=Desulfurococcus sp. TaxID=51678 RepID=UPI00317E5D07
MSHRKVIIGITMGDPAGAGPELALKALRKADYNIAKYVIIGSYKVLLKASSIVGLRHPSLIKIDDPTMLPDDPNVIGVYDLDNVDLSRLVYGKPSVMGGRASYEYIVKAVNLALRGLVDAVVTMPISKESLNMAGYKYPGHTELLAELTGAKEVRMMLVARHLRVVHVTTHIPLRKVPDFVRKERILKTIELTYEYLRNYFNIQEPRLAVAGLNPHSGEGGLFGDEEIKEITPAIEEAKCKGLNVSGPYPPDTVFYRAYYNKEFDAVVAMYHDQGHIPVKMVGFMEGVNITLGLPIIRVSPDHGTVWGKAGKGTADETASYEAIKLAVELAKNKVSKQMS